MIFAQENSEEIDYSKIVDSVIQYHYSRSIPVEEESNPIVPIVIISCFLILFGFYAYLQFGPSSQWRKGNFPKRLRYNSKNLFEAYICLGIEMAKADLTSNPKQQFQFLASYLKSKFPGFKHNYYEHIINTLPLNVKRYTVLDWLNEKMPQNERIQIIDFLADFIFYNQVAKSDEVNLLKHIAQKLSISPEEVNSILSIRFKIYEERKAYERKSQQTVNQSLSSLANAYSILGLENNASFDQVKKAYRNLAKKFHPDLFVSMGKAEQQMAHERFAQINEAYSKIEERQ